MASLADILRSCGLQQTPQLAESTQPTFPPFSIQLHGITDAPYFSGSTRVRVFLAHPAPPQGHLGTRNATLDGGNVEGGALEVFSALHPEGTDVGAQAMAESNLPILDAVQADAAECCAPWFSGAGSFAHVDGSVMCSAKHPMRASVVAVALIDVIDRRTSKSIGCIGGCVVHLNGRSGVMSHSIRRDVRVQEHAHADADHATILLSIAGDTLPLTSLVVEVQWGTDNVASRANAVTAKKLRALMFGAISVEHQVRLAPCLTRSASVSQEDRRRLLYQNAAYRSMRPVDINLTGDAAKIEFDRVSVAAPGGVVMAPWHVVESLGFLVFNLLRGATMTVHGLQDPEPLPVQGVGRSAAVPQSNPQAVLAPSPSLAHLMLFRVVVEGNDVVVGQTVRHNWEASLLHPTFPVKFSTFRFSEDTMMDDDDDDERVPQRPATNVDKGDNGGGDSTFDDLGELRPVTAMIRVFAMVPNYKTLLAAAKDPNARPLPASTNNSATRSSSAAASLLARFGFEHFEPMNPTHYQVIPYAWGVVDMVAPDQPFIKCKNKEPVTLYRGKPTPEILAALGPLLRPASSTVAGRKRRHLHEVVQQLRETNLLPAQAMRTRLVVSVNDASMLAQHRQTAVTGRMDAAAAAADEEIHDRLSLQRGWLGLGRRDVTIPQVEECLEATFRAFVFQ